MSFGFFMGRKGGKGPLPVERTTFPTIVKQLACQMQLLMVFQFTRPVSGPGLVPVVAKVRPTLSPPDPHS